MGTDHIMMVSLQLPWQQSQSMVTMATDNIIKISLSNNLGIAKRWRTNFLIHPQQIDLYMSKKVKGTLSPKIFEHFRSYAKTLLGKTAKKRFFNLLDFVGPFYKVWAWRNLPPSPPSRQAWMGLEAWAKRVPHVQSS